MISCNWFLSTSITNVTFLLIINNLPPRFYCKFFVLVALLLKHFNFVRKEKKMFKIFSPLLNKKKKKKFSPRLQLTLAMTAEGIYIRVSLLILFISLQGQLSILTKKNLVCFLCSKKSLWLGWVGLGPKKIFFLINKPCSGRGSGMIMKKPGLNLTHCRSYPFYLNFEQKAFCYKFLDFLLFLFFILLQIISISTIIFLVNLNILGKVLLCLVDHLY